jgi:hypothetical protein
MPHYITCGGLMDPHVRLVIDSQTTPSFKSSSPLFIGPSFDGYYSGSQFGNCEGACVRTITITGKNFGPAVRTPPRPNHACFFFVGSVG